MKTNDFDEITDQFATPVSWTGGHYELVIYLGKRSEDRAANAVRELWSHPLLDGCFLSKILPPSTQEKVNPQEHVEDRLYGIATLPNKMKSPCGSALWRFDDGSDWLGLFLPLESLSRAYSVGSFPFGEKSGYFEWQRQIDDWFRGIASQVFNEVSFELAVIGFEVDFSDLFIEAIRTEGIPRERRDGWLLRTESGLQWYPPTV